MFRLTINGLAARKKRMASTALAVILGVAFMAGTLILSDTLSSTFQGVFRDAHQGVDALVRSPSEVVLSYGEPGPRFDRATADAVASVPGVAAVAPQVTGYAQLVGPDGRPVGDQSGAPAFGLNWVSDATLNPYHLVEGRAPAADDEIVIDRASAEASGYQVGDTATVLSKEDPRPFTIAGVATFGSADSAAGASSVLFTDAAAEAVLSGPGQIDGIAIAVEPGVAPDVVTERIRAAVPASLEVVTGARLVAEDVAAFDESFGPFKAFLMVFAVVAVFVGSFIINNTFSITFAQRSRDMAMLRAIGASRRQVLASVAGEAVIIGVAASVIGVLAGVAAAIGLQAMLNGFGVPLPAGPMVVTAGTVALGLAVGIGVTVVSAWLPARRAGRIRPIAALRDVAVDRSGSSRSRTVVGLAVTAASVAALTLGLSSGQIELVGVGAFVSFLGVSVLGPVLARPVTLVLGWPLRRFGLPAEMGTRNALRNPTRTARTASSLMIGVALVAFIAVFGASVKSSFGGALEDDFRGTHVIDAGGFDTRGGISPELARTLRSTPGVETVTETRIVPEIVEGNEGTLSTFDAATVGSVFDLGPVEGDLTALGAEGIAVEDDHAREMGWTLGTTVPVTLPTGTVPFVVRAIYAEGLWTGDHFVDVAAIDAALPDQADFRVYVTGDDGAVRAAASTYPSVTVLDQQEFFASATSQIDQVLGVIYALLALAVVIALLGIANTLALSIFERTRELGLLRAVGMTRRQLSAAVRWEAVIIALFGTALGLGIGTFFGWSAVHAMADEGISILTVPVTTLGVITAIAAIAGALAAVTPARRAARLSVLDSLATG